MQLLTLARQNAYDSHSKKTCDLPQVPVSTGNQRRMSPGHNNRSPQHSQSELSVFDTPAPRTQRPVPTFCEPVPIIHQHIPAPITGVHS